jgi:hypothetical protein
LDAKTFSYCGRRSGVGVRTGRRLAGPKHAEYRNGDCYACTDDDDNASTGNRARRHPTDDDCNASAGNGARRLTTDGGYNASTGNRARRLTTDGGYNASARRRPTGDDHGRAPDPDEEKEGCENKPAAGDRKVHRQRYGTRALSQIGAERVPALYSVREIALDHRASTR